MKIAFCFLTYDNIIRNDIWNTFFENISTDKYIVFIHPKKYNNNIVLNYNFPYNIVKERVYTKSKDDISIVNATLKLLEETYNYDNNITHFVFLTQSCIPLYNFDKLYEIITKFNNSVISVIYHNKKERHIKLSPIMKKYIYYNNFVKQQPNMILIRDDVKDLINNNFIGHFANMECPDEHYFINIMMYVFKKKIIKQQINFCNNDFSRTQALEFKNVSSEFINHIRNHGFLFMRKVSKDSFISDITS